MRLHKSAVPGIYKSAVLGLNNLWAASHVHPQRIHPTQQHSLDGAEYFAGGLRTPRSSFCYFRRGPMSSHSVLTGHSHTHNRSPTQFFMAPKYIPRLLLTSQQKHRQRIPPQSLCGGASTPTTCLPPPTHTPSRVKTLQTLSMVVCMYAYAVA